MFSSRRLRAVYEPRLYVRYLHGNFTRCTKYYTFLVLNAYIKYNYYEYIILCIQKNSSKTVNAEIRYNKMSITIILGIIT